MMNSIVRLFGKLSVLLAFWLVLLYLILEVV